MVISVDSFGGEVQERRLIGVRIQCGKEVRFEVEGVEVGLSRYSKEKLVTGTEGTTGVVIEVVDEETRDGDEERVIPVEKVIVLVPEIPG